MAEYLLRTIDPKLWARVKRRAEREGREIKFVLLTLLTEYVSHGLRQDQK